MSRPRTECTHGPDKTCTKCRARLHYARNADEQRAKTREYYKKNSEAVKAKALLWRCMNVARASERHAQMKGVPWAPGQIEIATKWLHEKRVCDNANCGWPFYVSNPNYRPRHLDHDHKTGLLRGLLCRWCNTALGALRDDKSLLLSLVSYLDRAYTAR